ncbi:hypothetical protein ABID80_005443 [Streptomyces sp. PvP037]|uniref:hypothetical protein n=1 Tax=Streptomyces sp. PvP037 TaxID=3156437 RepID=UPI003391A226
MTVWLIFEGFHPPPLLLPRRPNREPLGRQCPKLSSRKHGSYSIRQERPPREDGTRRSFSRAGYESLKAAQADLDHIRALLGLADTDDPEGMALIAAMLEEVEDEKSPLPDVEETRRRLKSGQDLIGRLTVSEWLDRWLDGKRIHKSGLNRLRDRYPVPFEASDRPPPSRPAAREPSHRDVHGHRRRQCRDP